MNLLIAHLRTYYSHLTQLEQQFFPSTLKEALENQKSSNFSIIKAALMSTILDQESFDGLRVFFASPYIQALRKLNTAGLLITPMSYANFKVVVSHKYPIIVADVLILHSKMQDYQISESSALHKKRSLKMLNQIALTSSPQDAAVAVDLLNKSGLLSTLKAEVFFHHVLSHQYPIIVAKALILQAQMHEYHDELVVQRASLTMDASDASPRFMISSIEPNNLKIVAEALDMLNKVGLLSTSEAHVTFNSVLVHQDPLFFADQLIISNIFEHLNHLFQHSYCSLLELLPIRNGQSTINLFNELRTKLSKLISMPLTIDLEKILCYALENQYLLISDFLLKAIDVSLWLQHGLVYGNERLMRPLIRKLMLSRLIDPYDLNYQHISVRSFTSTTAIESLSEVDDTAITSLVLNEVKDALKNYDKGNPLSDEALISLCVRLKTLNTSSDSLQSSLIARHNLYINETSDTLAEQEWLRSKSVTHSPHLISPLTCSSPSVLNSYEISELMSEFNFSAFETALTTFKMIGLFKKPEIELMKKVTLQFKQLLNEGCNLDKVQDLLSDICELLAKSGIDAVKTLEHAYLRPLLYLLDNKQKTVPEHENLPISREKLIALKHLYQAFTSVTVSPVPGAEVYVVATGKILHSLLILTEQKQILLDWFACVLSGENYSGKTVTELLKYVTKKHEVLSKWMDDLTELDQLMNLATSQALQFSLDLSQATVCRSIEKIIFNANQYQLSVAERQEIMEDIVTDMDLSQLNTQSGLIRHYPLLLIAAKHYDKKGLSKESDYLLSIAFTLRFMHQLSAVRNLSQLLILAEEMSDLLLSGALGIVPQIFGTFGVVYTELTKINSVENKVDFCIDLIAKIEIALPENSEWRDALMVWLSTARLGLDIYTLIHISSNDRLTVLKEKEYALEQQPIFLQVRKTALRLLISAYYLYELSSLIATTQSDFWQKYFLKILDDFLKPAAIIWEQHEITAAVVLVPKLIKSIEHITTLSQNELSIENYIKPILIAMRETNDIFDNLERKKLLDRKSSLVCTMVSSGKKYLEVGNVLNQAFKTGKLIAKQIKSLQFFAKGFVVLAPDVPVASQSASCLGSIITAIQSGDLEAAQDAVTQLPEVVSVLNHDSSTVGNMVASASNASMSVLNIIGAVAAVANIGVNIYYGEQTLSELRKLSDQLSANNQEQTEQYKKLTDQIEMKSLEIANLIKDVDQRVNRLTNLVEFFYHNAITHQQHLLCEVQGGFKLLLDRLEFIDENANIRSLNALMYNFFDKSSIIEQSMRLSNFDEPVIQALITMYRLMICPNTGLNSYSLNGQSIHNPSRARSLLYLQQTFNQPNQYLPNLGYWIQGCRIINRFLNHFFQLPESSQEIVRKLMPDHIEIVWKTQEILHALKAITTRSQIIDVLYQLQQNPTNKKIQQHVHDIARLCGVPLHQFGEVGFELWSQVGEQTNPRLQSDIRTESQTLDEMQQRQKKMLEAIIIETLMSIISSNDLPEACSSFTLSMQSLLMELVNAGNMVFPSFSVKLFEGRSNSSLLCALSSAPSDYRLFLAQNSSVFFDSPTQEITIAPQTRNHN